MRAADKPPVFIGGDARKHAHPEEYGYEAIRQHLALNAPPDGLFCTNDLQALGARRALREHGLVVGRDVLVAGYDDQTFAAYLDPPLTSVRQPKAELGARAVAMVAELAAAGASAKTPRQELLPVELVPRASTGTRAK